MAILAVVALVAQAEAATGAVAVASRVLVKRVEVESSVGEAAPTEGMKIEMVAAAAGLVDIAIDAAEMTTWVAGSLASPLVSEAE